VTKKGIIIATLLIAVLMVSTFCLASAASTGKYRMKTCDSSGTQKECFDIAEPVYLQGKEFNVPDGTYSIYVVSDVEDWSNGLPIPAPVAGSATSVHIVGGAFGPIAIFTGLSNAKYDVVLDVGGDGVYDVGDIDLNTGIVTQGDALDNDDVSHTAGFIVGSIDYQIYSTTAAGTTQREVYDVVTDPDIYVAGQDFSVPDGSYPIYLVEDQETWSNNMAIPARVAGSITTVNIVGGHFGPTLLWHANQAGKYDIVLDVNKDGKWNAGDALDNDDVVSSPGLIVTPENALGSLLAIVSCLGAFTVATKYIKRKQ
jgi:hypothetical protein